MPKRKAVDEDAPTPVLRRSTRAKPATTASPPPPPPAKPAKSASHKPSTAADKKQATPKQAPAAAKKVVKKETSESNGKSEEQHGAATTKTKANAGSSNKSSDASKAVASATKTNNGSDETTADGERWYWLLKAEPESRFENGTDVKFSIDDLKARTEPEPWDGIRNYVARNNLRAMKKGELAFFYHSNCKEPGIVGTMEIVQEHSPDLSAHNSKAPYYDPKSKPDDPKWSVVHVKFRSKFVQQIGLQELRDMGKPGSPLENMQMLKQSRLSVSRVSPAEWEYLMGVVKDRGGETS